MVEFSHPKVPLRHFSATVRECPPLWGIRPWPARGGCHERSPERFSTVLLRDRVRYRDCDRGRDAAHLSGKCVLGLGSLDAIERMDDEEPAWVIASSNACFRLGPDARRA